MTWRESAPRAAETLAPPGPPPARGGLRVPTGLTAGRDCESRILSYILFFRTEVRVTGCRRQGRRLAMRDRMAQPQKPLPRPSTQGGGIVVSCGELRNSSAARAVAQLMRHVSSGTQLAKGDSGGAQAPSPALARGRGGGGPRADRRMQKIETTKTHIMSMGVPLWSYERDRMPPNLLS